MQKVQNKVEDEPPSKDESFVIQHEQAKDPRRWYAMGLIFLYQISQLYNYDTPSLIQTRLMKEFKVSNS